MLINISGRTDIVNYYSDWMFKRFEEGTRSHAIPCSPIRSAAMS